LPYLLFPILTIIIILCIGLAISIYFYRKKENADGERLDIPSIGKGAEITEEKKEIISMSVPAVKEGTLGKQICKICGSPIGIKQIYVCECGERMHNLCIYKYRTCPNPRCAAEYLLCSICHKLATNSEALERCSRCLKTFHNRCLEGMENCPICGTKFADLANLLLQSEKEAIKPYRRPVIVDGKKEKSDIEEAFLIYHDGRLISRVGYNDEKMDSLIFAGMLSAVQVFIKDSFSNINGSLNILGYGKKKIVIERGQQMFLVVVLTGDVPKKLRENMRSALIVIWDEYKNVLKQWDGASNIAPGISDIVRSQVFQQSKNCTNNDLYT
ncbi:MAG: hypothetical protein AB1779_11205, partial [Candidatus Thermoplasmatota archaeon]